MTVDEDEADYYCVNGVGDCAMAPCNASAFLAGPNVGPQGLIPDFDEYVEGQNTYSWGPDGNGHWWVCEKCHFTLLSMHRAGVPLSVDGCYCIEEIPA